MTTPLPAGRAKNHERNIADPLDGLEFFQEFSYREREILVGYQGYNSAGSSKVLLRRMLILTEGKVSILKSGESGRHLLFCAGRGASAAKWPCSTGSAAPPPVWPTVPANCSASATKAWKGWGPNIPA